MNLLLRKYVKLLTLVAPLVAAPAFGQFSVDPAVSYPVGLQPDSVAAVDVDGDGDLDLAVPADMPDRVVLLLNDGAGAYSAGGSIPLPNSSSPGAIVAGDLDGDLDDDDLAVALKDFSTVMILLNSGGTYIDGGQYATELEPRGLAIADHDGNGSLDLAVANRDSNSVTILTNDGTGSFSSQHVATGAEPRDAAFGDFDGNGLLDVAVTNHDDRTVRLVLNSAGTFSAGGTLSVGPDFRPDGIVAGDLDGDLDADIAAATNGDGLNQATVFINNGGSFSGPFHYATGGLDTSQIAIADLDCDDDLDLVTINRDSSDMSLLSNDGSGAFGAAMTMATGTDPEDLTVADLDGDGDPDIAVANRTSNDVTVSINGCEPGDGGGGNPGGGDNPGPSPGFTFAETASVAAGVRPSGLAGLDLDGDMDTDLVTTADDPDRLVVLLNDGSGGFTPGAPVALPASSSPEDVVAGDFDGDMDTDLAVSLKDLNQVILVVNTGGVLSLGATVATGSEPRQLDVGDHDGDGDPDLVVVNRASNDATVLTNNGGSFSPTTLAAGSDPRGVAFADIDDDDDLDVAITNHDDRTISLYRNDGGTFTALAPLSIGSLVRPEGIVGTDLDGNGIDDLAVAANGGGFEVAAVYLSTGTGFQPQQFYNTGGTNTSDIIAADLDCDGDDDLVTANRDSSDLAVLGNDGSGVFGAAQPISAGTAVSDPLAVDLDGDGNPDLAAANRDSNDVSVVINESCVACAADVDGNGAVDVDDLVAIILAWGNPGGPEDVNTDGIVDVDDLITAVLAWGVCQ